MKQSCSKAAQAELLIGPRTAEQDQHLRECAECSAAVARMEASLAEFGTAYRELGEQLPAFRASAAIGAQGARGTVRMWMRAGVVAALLGAIALIPAEHYRQSYAARLAMEDEALLTAVQADVSRSVPASFEPLATGILTEAGNGSSR